MAVNSSRSMNQDFDQGTVDSSYISIVPDRGGVLGSVPTERLSWPTYQQAEQHVGDPFGHARAAKNARPVEIKSRGR